jgi:hypothetical protein
MTFRIEINMGKKEDLNDEPFYIFAPYLVFFDDSHFCFLGKQFWS